MSDEEDQVEVSEEEEEDEAEETPAKSAPSDHEEEEEEEEEDEETKSAASEEEEEEEEEPSGPSEAELAAKKRQTAEHYKALNEEAQELLSNNAVEREKLGSEIEEMRKRSERRKKEREAEEKRAAAKRTEEEAERKAAEEERRRKKEADELERKAKKLEKMAELERLKNPSKPNFVITKKDGPIATEESTTASAPKKSKEQLEAEKQAILKQRIPALDIDGADGAKFKAKANELHALIVRLESEKYDLEKRFKSQQVDMMELAEKARNIHKTTGSEAIRRVALGQDEVDKVQERFAGCPSKVIMYSEFERQKDKRTYDDKRVNFTGPVFADPVAKIAPKRIVKWDESTGLPIYQTMDGAPVEEGHAAAQEEE